MPITALKIKLQEDPELSGLYDASASDMNGMKNLAKAIEGFYLLTAISEAEVIAMQDPDALQVWITDDATDAQYHPSAMGRPAGRGSGLLFDTKTKAELQAIPAVNGFHMFETKITKPDANKQDIDAYHLTVKQLLGINYSKHDGLDIRIDPTGDGAAMAVPGFRFSTQNFNRLDGNISFHNDSAGGFAGGANGAAAWAAFLARNSARYNAGGNWATMFESSVFVPGYTNRPARANDLTVSMKYFTESPSDADASSNNKYRDNDRMVEINVNPKNTTVSPVDRFVVRLYGEYIISR